MLWMISRWSSGSSPPSADSSVTMASSSELYNESVASGSGMRSSRINDSAVQLRNVTAGRKRRLKVRITGLTRRLVPSGSDSARAFGIISPSTTCRYVMILSATRKPTVCAAVSDKPIDSNGSYSQWAMAGSPYIPRPTSENSAATNTPLTATSATTATMGRTTSVATFTASRFTLMPVPLPIRGRGG